MSCKEKAKGKAEKGKRKESKGEKKSRRLISSTIKLFSLLSAWRRGPVRGDHGCELRLRPETRSRLEFSPLSGAAVGSRLASYAVVSRSRRWGAAWTVGAVGWWWTSSLTPVDSFECGLHGGVCVCVRAVLFRWRLLSFSKFAKPTIAFHSLSTLPPSRHSLFTPFSYLSIKQARHTLFFSSFFSFIPYRGCRLLLSNHLFFIFLLYFSLVFLFFLLFFFDRYRTVVALSFAIDQSRVSVYPDIPLNVERIITISYRHLLFIYYYYYLK